ncbi:MAG: fructosamine kinase family protein [Wenzhouxiangellaceae bacterium]
MTAAPAESWSRDPQAARVLADLLGLNPDRARLAPVHGSQSARAWSLDDSRTRCFIKTVAASDKAMLDAERDGLARIAATGAVATPKVIGEGVLGYTAWLALEWLDLHAPDRDGWARLGVQMVQLHGELGEWHGLDRDNFLGATPQLNHPTADWTTFFWNFRLLPQLEALESCGQAIGQDRRDRLAARLTEDLRGHAPRPSLLHGDFWSGNVGMLASGEMVVYDPAVHYGDHECDLAMAALFGGFEEAFFSAYRAHWPLAPGWQRRRLWYQLYHLLNHAQLFGGHYLRGSLALIDTLIADPND